MFSFGTRCIVLNPALQAAENFQFKRVSGRAVYLKPLPLLVRSFGIKDLALEFGQVFEE
jgi:hypothetical protein